MSTADRRHPSDTVVPLEDLLDGWVEQGLVTREQAVRLRGTTARSVAVPRRPARSRAALSEALAYLGAAIVVTGALLLGSLLWDDLSVGPRIAVLANAVVLLVAAGALVRPDRAGAAPAAAHASVAGRLRSVLWAGAVVVAAPTLAVTADASGLEEARAAALTTWGTAGLAGVLWWRWRAPLQQVATMAAVAAGGAALVAQVDVPDETLGLGVWVAGVVWALLGWSGLTRPRPLGLVGGSVLAVFGAMMTASSDPGTVFTLATLVVLLAVALHLRDLGLTVVAAVGVVVNLPAAVTRWFPGSFGVPIALLLVGAVVVVLAVVAARRGRGRSASAPARAPGSPRLAMATASVVVAGAAAVVAQVARVTGQ